MKMTKSLFLAFAGLGLFACSNEEVTTDVNNGGDNSIVIKLDGLSDGSRSIGAPETNTTTSISDVAILLSDGTNILKKEVITASSDAGSDWKKLTDTGSGYIMHNVNSHVREVHVIGNYTKNNEVSTWVATAENSTIAAMNDVVIKAAAEQDFDGVTLYGVDSELTTEAGGDTSNPPHTDGTTPKMLYADVTINHLVSRIEIGDIKCKDLGGTFKELTLKYIGLLNYYNRTTIGGTASDAMTLETVLEPTAENATPAAGKHSWSNTSETADYSWAWDAFPANAKLTSNSPAYNPEADPETEDVTEKFVYQFIPSQVGGANFNVKLYLDATEKTTDATSALNTVTANFTGDSNFTYEPGKIYKLNFEFGEDNIGPWNPDETICVKVKVTVQPWEIKTLTPTFE